MLLLGLLEAGVQLGWISSYLIAPPSAMLRYAVPAWRDWGTALFETWTNATLGLGLSVVFALGVSVLFSYLPWVERMFLPLMVFFQTVPIIAIAPLLVIWFGYGPKTVIASAWIVSFFPVLSNGIFGFAQVDPRSIELFRLMNATPTKIFWGLRFPRSIPYWVQGIRLGSGLAVIGAIVGEFIAGGGLGGFIDSARNQQRIDQVFFAVFIGTFLGLFYLKLIDVVGRTWFKRYFYPSV